MSERSQIDYLAWDRSQWSAKLESVSGLKAGDIRINTTDPGFYHAPQGDWTRDHAEQYIDYLGHDGISHWSAKVHATSNPFTGSADYWFEHALNRDWDHNHAEKYIDFLDWDGKKMRATVHETGDETNGLWPKFDVFDSPDHP